MKLPYFGGQIKVWLQRLQTYLSLVSFFMIFYVFIEKNRWLNWYEWLLFIVIVCSIVLYLDVRYIMPNALGYQWEKNKAFKRLERKVDLVMEALGVVDCKE